MTKNFNDTISALRAAGLNLFASAKVENLSSEIKTSLTDTGIVVNENDIEMKNTRLCLVAGGGKTLWENLPKNPLSQNKIDDYSIAQIKNHFPDARILFPSDNYLFPLQKIGRAFNLGHPSQLGIDINHDYGLWFAYRCLFLTKAEIPESRPAPFTSPCESCAKKPCLKERNFQKARKACHYQCEQKYTDEQIQYHQNYLNVWLKSGRNNS